MTRVLTAMTPVAAALARAAIGGSARKRSKKTKRSVRRQLVPKEVVISTVIVYVTLPLYTVCEANEHIETRWGAIAKSKRRKLQRDQVFAALREVELAAGRMFWPSRSAFKFITPHELRAGKKVYPSVRMVRLSPGTLDPGGNLESALKSVRDEIAAFYGVSDGKRGPIKWSCDQERGRAYGVRIELRSRS